MKMSDSIDRCVDRINDMIHIVKGDLTLHEANMVITDCETINVFQDIKLPLEKIIYGCWRGEKVCAAWSGNGDSPAKTYSIKVDGKATTPVSITRTEWEGEPVILIGHKAGVAVTDAQLKPIEGMSFFSNSYDVDQGQFRSAIIVGKTIYAAHYSPDSDKVFPMNGIYTAQYRKGKRLKRIIPKQAGPLLSFRGKPYFIHGTNLKIINRGNAKVVFHEEENTDLTSGYANSNAILLGTADGFGHVLDQKFEHYSKRLIPYSPKVTSIAKVQHQGESYIVAGSDFGDLVVWDFPLKGNKPIVSHNLNYCDDNSTIRRIVVPKEENGTFYVALSDIILELSMGDLLTRKKEQIGLRANSWKGASSSIYSMDVLLK